MESTHFEDHPHTSRHDGGGTRCSQASYTEKWARDQAPHIRRSFIKVLIQQSCAKLTIQSLLFKARFRSGMYGRICHHAGKRKSHCRVEQDSTGRVHSAQPVFHSLRDVRELEIRQSFQIPEEGIDCGNEACGKTDRAHPLPGRNPEYDRAIANKGREDGEGAV